MSELSKYSGSRLRLVCVSNGHGEDIIAVRILQELQRQASEINVAALPIVGEGRAYKELNVPLIGTVQAMPSGGFIYMDGRQLLRDLRGGLLRLTLSQIRAVRNWALQTEPVYESRAILAVGDIVPLLFAWLSGADYVFVGTARSEYYLRDERGLLPQRQLLSLWEGWSGSVYHPWERWLMSHPRCKAVFPRDSLTTEILKKWSIPAFDLGNPMMDQLQLVKTPQGNLDADKRSLTIILLPGSRPPEVYNNWQRILVAVAALCKIPSLPLLFLGAIAPGISIELLHPALIENGFQEQERPLPISDPEALTFTGENASLILTQHAYQECLHLADLAIAMAGTATEQFVGLGKPAIIFPGAGPQFTPAFAEAQTRLLGPSVILVQNPAEVADAVESLLYNSARLQLIAENGTKRMGKPGASRRIAACLLKRLRQN